jgi:hypothetical protein
MTLLTVLKPGGAAAAITGLPVTTDGTTPNLIVEIDWDTDPTTPIRTWTDITQYVRSISYTLAGRQHELQRTEAGTLNCTVSNRDGRFDPTNTTGAYYPNVKRTRWIRVRSVWAGLIYAEWQGLIEAVTAEWPSAGFDATASITASDAFKPLNLYDLNGKSYPEQTTGARVAAVAADAQVQVGSTDIGVSVLPAITFTSTTSALSHLQSLEDNEAGLVFTNAAGALTFHDRHHRTLFNDTSLATIGDGFSATYGYGLGPYGTGPYGGAAEDEIPYTTAVRFEYDDSNIWNKVVVTPAQDDTTPDTPPVPQEATNAASITAHYQRTLLKTLLTQSQTEALAAAQFYAAAYAEPTQRIPVCEVIGRKAPGFWPVILAAKNSDRFVWKRRPTTEASARTIELNVFVEKKMTTIIPGTNWQVSFQFSPADNIRYWRLGVPGYSELNTSAVLGY